MEGKVNPSGQNQWEGQPGEELSIPEAYIRDLRYEIVVFVRKERGGSDFTFRCSKYKRKGNGRYKFKGVIIDTSKRNAEGEVELVRLSYHPELVLVSVPFMVIPATEPSSAG
ncbi:hypothetical protein ES703_110555 [subsurface metagenome]